MELILEARSLLEESGYATQSIELANKAFHFEDDTIMGFCVICSSIDELLKNWNMWQNNFLKRFTDNITSDSIKAWNIYSVYFASETPNSNQVNELLNIEENFQQTRKIARANVKTKKDLGHSLLHLLPIQNIFETERQNFEQILDERISEAQKALLKSLENLDPKEIIKQYLV